MKTKMEVPHASNSAAWDLWDRFREAVIERQVLLTRILVVVVAVCTCVLLGFNYASAWTTGNVGLDSTIDAKPVTGLLGGHQLSTSPSSPSASTPAPSPKPKLPTKELPQPPPRYFSLDSPWGYSENWWAPNTAPPPKSKPKQKPGANSTASENGTSTTNETWEQLANRTVTGYHSLFSDLSTMGTRSGQVVTFFPTEEQRVWMQLLAENETAQLEQIQTMKMEVQHDGVIETYPDVQLRYHGRQPFSFLTCNISRSFEITLPEREGKVPFSRYILLNLCEDISRLSYMLSVKLMKQFGLFPPRARFMHVGVADPLNGSFISHGVQLALENPYDALQRIRPGAELYIRTDNDELAPVSPGPDMYAFETKMDSDSDNDDDARRAKGPKMEWIPLPNISEVDDDNYIALLAINSLLKHPYVQNDLLFYRAQGEKWRVSAWNAVRAGMGCLESSPPSPLLPVVNPELKKVPNPLIHCAYSKLDWQVHSDKSLSAKLRGFLAKETSDGGRLSPRTFMFALGEVWIEYQVAIPYYMGIEFDWMQKNITARYAELAAALKG